MAEYIRFFTNPDKLSAAIVYLAQRSLHDDHFGETKLVKLLYYADCAAYHRTGEPITGTTYIRMDHGPYPTGGRLLSRTWKSAASCVCRKRYLKQLGPYANGGYRTRMRILLPSLRTIAAFWMNRCIDSGSIPAAKSKHTPTMIWPGTLPPPGK